MTSGVPLVEVIRSDRVESVHGGRIVLLDSSGSTTLALGPVDEPIYPRSANKPLQAVGMVQLGLDVPPEQLAIAAASHSGEPVHLRTVAALLDGAGLHEDDLQCPPDRPFGEDARERWIAAGDPARRIAMNCSGKHAAMLATCRVNGWPIADYLDPAHPLQVALRASVGEQAGEHVAAVGVDGCGAPVFALTPRGLAVAFAALASAGDGPRRRVAGAMRQHPELVGGTGRLVTRLLAGVPGLVAKDGAEGVYAAALPDGPTVAFKIDDGATRAAEVTVVGALLRSGVDAAVLTESATVPVHGGGRPVGVVRSLLTPDLADRREIAPAAG